MLKEEEAQDNRAKDLEQEQLEAAVACGTCQPVEHHVMMIMMSLYL